MSTSTASVAQEAIPVLHHVGLVAEDPATLAQLIERVFGFSVLDDRSAHIDMSLGGSVVRINRKEDHAGDTSGARNRPLRYVALCAADLSPVLDRVRNAALPLENGNDAGGFYLTKDEWTGVSLRLTEGKPPQTSDADGEGLFQGLDHIGVASPDNRRVHQRYSSLLGLPVESQQTDTETRISVEQFTSDKYGVRTWTQEVGHPTGLRVTFLSTGSTDLEFLQDLRANDGAASEQTPERQSSTSTSGDGSAIARDVQNRGPGLHHLAIRVRDMDAALRRAERQGVELINHRGRPGSRRADIAFMHPASTGGILFHLVAREP